MIKNKTAMLLNWFEHVLVLFKSRLKEINEKWDEDDERKAETIRMLILEYFGSQREKKKEK